MPAKGERDWNAKMYEDTGCIVSPSCLRCPLAQCVLDDPSPWSAVNRWRNRERNERIMARVAAGEARAVVAREEGMSTRAVDRVLQRSERTE